MTLGLDIALSDKNLSAFTRLHDKDKFGLEWVQTQFQHIVIYLIL